MTEGDAFVLPVRVHEPDNDVVEYAVQYVVGGVAQQSLPRGAAFVTDPKTAEKRFVWWPDLTQAGAYTFRFRAVDEKGASSDTTVSLQVGERTGSPAIKMTKGWPVTEVSPLAVDAIVVEEGLGSFSVLVEVFDPEGETVSAEFSGIPKAVVAALGPGRYVWAWDPSRYHSDLGVYQGLITATDTSGRKTSANLTLEVRRVWFHQDDVVYVHPVPQAGAGLVRMVEGNGLKASVVRGSVTFGIGSNLLWGQGPFPFPAEGKYRYLVHTPDGNGNDIRTYLSGILTGPQTIAWDSASLPDGVYALDIEFADGGTAPESDLSRFVRTPLALVVDNDGVPETGSQWLPVIGRTGFRDMWHEAMGVDWIYFSGSQTQATVHPYPYRFVPAAQTDAERQVLASNNEWFAETWLKVWNGRYDADPGFFRIQEGHVIVAGVQWYSSYLADWSERFPETDGGRNQVSISSYSSLRPNPRGPGFIGIGREGRLFKIDPTGTVTTLASWITPSAVVPFHPWDSKVTLEQLQTEQKRLVGVFEGNIPFKFSHDLAIDPLNPNHVYVADSGNHRIALVDLSGLEARVSIFAGTPGTSGYGDGDRLSALFNNPTSVEIVDGKLYVVDRGNSALRAIDLATGQVTTPVGKGPGAPQVPECSTLEGNIDAYTWGSVSFQDAALVCPQWIRRFSNGDLLLAEAVRFNTSGGNLRRIRLSEQRVDQLVSPDGKPLRPWRGYTAVPDWQGRIGPVDDIITGGSNSTDQELYRITAAGVYQRVSSNVGFPAYYEGDTVFAKGTTEAYPVGGIVIDDDEARLAYIGQYLSGLIVLRPLTPEDPKDIDFVLSSYGRDIYYAGTLPIFHTAYDRSSFPALHGLKGFNRYGNIPHFDDLAALADAELASYIRSGMGGKVSRPELTGRDLQALIYYIRVVSLQGKRERIDPNQIAQNLHQAGYWDSLTDLRVPEIRNAEAVVSGQGTAQITWQTDEPTIGFVRYGPTDYYGLASAIESAYAKDHAVTLTNLQQDKRYYLRILSKDQAWNLTHHQASFDVGTPPAVLCGDLNNDGQVTIADAVLLAQVIVGSRPTPQPPCIADFNSDGQIDVVDLVLLIKHILGQVAKPSCCGG